MSEEDRVVDGAVEEEAQTETPEETEISPEEQKKIDQALELKEQAHGLDSYSVFFLYTYPDIHSLFEQVSDPFKSPKQRIVVQDSEMNVGAEFIDMGKFPRLQTAQATRLGDQQVFDAMLVRVSDGQGGFEYVDYEDAIRSKKRMAVCSLYTDIRCMPGEFLALAGRSMAPLILELNRMIEDRKGQLLQWDAPIFPTLEYVPRGEIILRYRENDDVLQAAMLSANKSGWDAPGIPLAPNSGKISRSADGESVMFSGGSQSQEFRLDFDTYLDSFDMAPATIHVPAPTPAIPADVSERVVRKGQPLFSPFPIREWTEDEIKKNPALVWLSVLCRGNTGYGSFLGRLCTVTGDHDCQFAVDVPLVQLLRPHNAYGRFRGRAQGDSVAYDLISHPVRSKIEASFRRRVDRGDQS